MTTPPYSTVPPHRNKGWKIFGLIALGIFLLSGCGIVACTAGLIAASPSPTPSISFTPGEGQLFTPDSPVEETTEPPTTTTTEETTPPPATINTSIRDGKFEFTVLSLKCGATHVGGEYLGDDAQGKFCIMKLTVKNIGDQSQMLDASNQFAFNAAGQRYDADSSASMSANYSENGTSTFLEDINPGNSVTGKVVFDIPKDQTVSSLELHDSYLSGGVTIKVT